MRWHTSAVKNLLPRGLEIVPQGRESGSEVPTTSMTERVDYLVLSTDDLTSRRRREFYAALTGGKMEYELVLRERGEPPFNLLDTDGIYTNLKYLNPEIEVYQRSSASAEE